FDELDGMSQSINFAKKYIPTQKE
ncbi:sugar phosphate isomerase/epimerase family protein, partial [Bacillus cereus group sp. BceL175]